MGGDFSSVEIKNLQAENKRLRAQFKDLDVSPNVLLLAILVPLCVYSSVREAKTDIFAGYIAQSKRTKFQVDIGMPALTLTCLNKSTLTNLTKFKKLIFNDDDRPDSPVTDSGFTDSDYSTKKRVVRKISLTLSKGNTLPKTKLVSSYQ